MGNEKSKAASKSANPSRKNTGAETYKNQETSKSEMGNSQKPKQKDTNEKPPSETKSTTSNPTSTKANNSKPNKKTNDSSDSSDFEADSPPRKEAPSPAEKPKKDVPIPVRSKSEDPEYSDTIPLEIDPEDIHFGEFIGEGVYSEVYKGNCYGSQVAIKKFKNQSLDPEVLKQVRKEVRIMKSIRHPNLLLFLGASTKPGHFMILTELMDKSFHDVHKLKLDLISKLRMAKEAAKGISWLHSLTPAIIHRDLKPENILIDKTGTIVKVADFGLSLVKDHSKTEAEEMRKIRGSPAFMSPEALLGEDLTPKTDVYSFGMILWELLTGGSPYEHLQIESFEELIEEICKKGTREKIPKDTPQCLKALIQSCWQPNHRDRPSFLDILHQLDECILEVAIADKEGREMWKKDFTKDGELQINVPWDNFLTAIAAHFNLAPSLKIFAGLKALLVKDEKERNYVYIEDLGNALKWFGPMGTHTNTNFLTRMQNVFTKKWFHGDISVETAQTRLAGLEPGTYLIRFSSNPGSYALSKIIENQRKERAIVHIRISHEPGGNYNFVLDEQVYEYDSLDELVKAPVLGLSNPCPGSYYYAQFRIKQVVSGYVNTVNMS